MRLAVCRLRRRLPRDPAAGFTCQVVPVTLHKLFFLTPTEPLFLLPSVLYGTLVVSREFFRPFSGYYVFNALLLVLQALHIFWACLILRMVYKFVFMGKVRRLQPGRQPVSQRSHSLGRLFPQVERDERSDEESEAEDEPDEEGEECRREHRKGGINSKLTSLANNCMLNNLTNQRNINSRLPKAR